MLTHLHRILSELSVAPKSILPVMSAYLLALMLTTRRHDVRQAAQLSGIHESSFSRLLNRSDATVIAKKCLNRAAKRRLDVLPKLVRQGKKPLLLVDATLVARRGKNVKNCGKYNHGKGYVQGHKIVNFILLLGDEIIPLSSLCHYTKAYCKDNDLTYKTEAKLVEEWINKFPSADLIAKEHLKNIHFVFDCGYDVKNIQRAVRRIGAHFTMSVKSNRIVDGVQVKEYFRRHRHLTWQTIRLKPGNGGKGSQRSYRIRHQEQVRLKGFGSVTLICSQVRRKGSGKLSSKYLISSDSSLMPRGIVEIYKRRWTIETWHKDMKQNHGYRDCKSANFSAVEAHINLCLTAYCIVGQGIHGFLRQGTTQEQFQVAAEINNMAKTINLFGGRGMLKHQVQAVMRRIKVA